EAFVAVATARSVRAGAEQLHLTQPAVSMALAELERHLGRQLFDRERGRLYLNYYGRELLPMARDLLERMRELQRRAGDQPERLTGELRLGASNTVGNYLVGELLGNFVAAHEEVALRLSVGNTDAIVAGVLDHSLDLGCVEGPVAHPQLELRPWREDVMVVCTRPDHALARRRRLRAQDFAGARWILRERGSATRALSEHALSALPGGQVVMELGQVEAIKQAVIAGLGIACLPAAAVNDVAAAGRLAVLSTPFLDLRRTLSLVLHKTRYRGALIEAFLKAAR
ncbi:MAG TPA: LysR substrate-binding domain-containing protein, partial [Verrucomicrobiae bacterium]|nr:LysR substrate-binding domain-containing protein [Verrucomicrobiae bacterium]